MNENLNSGYESGAESGYQSSLQFGHEAEETLRLVAQLPAPAELTDRVHRRLDAALAAADSGRRSFWSLWMPAQRLQFAGAALLVLAIAGSAWTVRHTARGGAGNGQPGQQSSGQPIARPAPASGSQSSGASGFSTAGSETRPSNLNPIKVPPPPRKKPSASRTLTKKTAKGGAAVPDTAVSGQSAPKSQANQ